MVVFKKVYSLMKETFDEYKETLEKNFVNFTYLYDGDVISSKDLSYTETVNNHSISPSFIIRTIEQIYRKSFNIVFDKSLFNDCKIC